MTAQISPMLAVSDGGAAIGFYKAAFGAELLWHLGEGADVIAGLSIGGANFFLAAESPPHGTRAPASAGFTTVRIELFVDDPRAVHRRALEAGASEPGGGAPPRYHGPDAHQAHAARGGGRSFRSPVADREDTRVAHPRGDRRSGL